ncbi:uncharacterized protein LOC108296672 [Cebus imitator]|uniref:uncharacterized protein LOC108296672 n=1 Tax=Cebus imitator TaxID=2715852 RepID=UPI00080A5DAE|nr:uncharacterized protein LOC108296672 [Cebus imitator]
MLRRERPCHCCCHCHLFPEPSALSSPRMATVRDEKGEGRKRLALTRPSTSECARCRQRKNSVFTPGTQLFLSPSPEPYLLRLPKFLPQSRKPALGLHRPQPRPPGGTPRRPSPARGSPGQALRYGHSGRRACGSAAPRRAGRGERGRGPEGPISGRGCGRAAIGPPRGLQPALPARSFEPLHPLAAPWWLQPLDRKRCPGEQGSSGKRRLQIHSLFAPGQCWEEREWVLPQAIPGTGQRA